VLRFGLIAQVFGNLVAGLNVSGSLLVASKIKLFPAGTKSDF